MDDVVPSVLQRLRAADIIRMAGLAVASLGQEYCRTGAVQATMRRGAKLMGIVDTSNVGYLPKVSPTNRGESVEHVSSEHHRYVSDVEIQSPTIWLANCTCSPASLSICSHAAALLYQWLADPMGFATSSPSSPPNSSTSSSPKPPLSKSEEAGSSLGEQKLTIKPTDQPGQPGYIAPLRGPTPSSDLLDILTQMGLSELRGIAREYDITPIGLSKQQLADAIIEVLKQPEIVRKVASALEKPQRQLLATLILAGGSITDEDLHSLFERFGFGPPDKLQQILLTLQSKGLLFRTSLNSSPQQRIGLSGSLFDIGWSVPAEVRAALRVPLPITTFDVQKNIEGETEPPKIQHVEPYSLLSDLLLVARVLDGYPLEDEENLDLHSGMARFPGPLAPVHTPATGIHDGTGTIAPPGGLPSSSMLETAQSVLPRTPLFLRYAIRLLRLADILHKDDSGTPHLRLLPNTARLLLGPTRTEIARDLFELWLTQPGYEELFDLQEEGLRLRCRTTPLNHPILRPGELEAENNEARQILIGLIAQAPLNQWINFLAFARFIYRLNPTFLQKRQRLFALPHWWLEQEESRLLQPTQMNDWMRAEGHYLARLLRGPLHWWGITDLALSHDGRLLAFRLTPIAGLLLNGIAFDEQTIQQDKVDASPLLEVLETGELLVACIPAAWPLIEQVEAFAEAAGVRDNRLCYRLTPKSLAKALSRGQRPTSLIQLLQHIAEHEGQPDNPLTKLLPQLERWVASYGHIRLYTGVSLLEVADPLVMRELAATTSVEEQIVQRISPTLMILKKQGQERLVEELKKRGQVPLLHEEE